jgi:uncharacterized membrane protein
MVEDKSMTMHAKATTSSGRGATLESGVGVRRVPFDAPWDWLAAGWRDMWAIPGVSLTYGGVFALLAWALTFGLTAVGLQSLVLALGGGFLLIGPVFAVGLYEASRRLERAQPVALGDAVGAGFRAPGQLGFFGAILAFAFLVWVQIAFLLLMLFLGGGGLPPPSEFMQVMLFTPRGLGLLVVGTMVGGLLALIVFSISVLSVPLLMTHRIDAVTAIRTSIEAVIKNPKPMLLWAGLIAAFTAMGIATIFVGLVLVFPLIGHATWHAYRAIAYDKKV